MIFAAGAALIIANSSLSSHYELLLHLKITLKVGNFILAKPAHMWVNEFLMVFFFMIVGLEIKAELVEGSFADKRQIILPLISTIAGVVCPALFFYATTHHNLLLVKGWAIPTVTDIAFALCVLSFFKNSIPPYLRVFLLSLAIFDDLIGIVIIAIFYTKSISLFYLIASLVVTAIAIICNLRQIVNLTIYMVLALILWYLLLKSGVHATIAGVIIALCIPLKVSGNTSPLKRLIHILHPWVSYLIVPLFAFTSSGIHMSKFGFNDLLTPLPLGIMLGLFFGKQLGVFLSLLISIKTKLVKLPYKISWLQLYGVSILTGIGFTVSLFINDLSFPHKELGELAKIGILVGSLLSAIWGYTVLRISTKKP
jgi:NhaA family Na+:H+ antiporter